MWIAERVGKRDRPESSLNPRDAVIIGLVQCFALIPGVSRSGATISAGLLRNLDRVAATRLAFFLAIPALVAAGAYEAIKEASVISTGVDSCPPCWQRGQLCRRLRVNRLVAAIRGQGQHHGVHLISRGTGGGHRGAARYRDAEPDVDTIEHSANASPCRLSAAKADAGAADTSVRRSAW